MVTRENSKNVGVLLKMSRVFDSPFTLTISCKRLAREDYNCLTLLLPSRMSSVASLIVLLPRLFHILDEEPSSELVVERIRT